MPGSNSHQPYIELLKEFRQKIEFLKKEFNLEQQKIAAAIGEYPTNLSRYLDIRKERPCGVRKLLEMLAQLGEKYARELSAFELPEPPGDLHSLLTGIHNTLMAIHHVLLDMAGRSKAG